MVAAAANSSPTARAPVLNSWKEIAVYLGRGVRTVQRYERDLHLPVRRLGGRTRGAVVAIPEDLDAWLRVSNFNEARLISEIHGDLTANLRDSILQGRELRKQSQSLRSANRLARSNLISNLSALVEKMKATSSPINDNPGKIRRPAES